MKKLLLILLLVTTTGFSQSTNYKQLDSFLELLYQNNKVMGSLSILQKGESVYNKSVGFQYIDQNERKLATIATKYRVGSITKTFTATLIFQLVDEGKIKLGDKLSVYFPKVTNASNITIANLLNHSSGLFNITNDEDFQTWMLEPTTQAEMLSRILKYDVVFQPGVKHEYSNTNYVLLGYILEKIENKSYKAILEERIVDKLDLDNTYYGSNIDITDKECLSYYFENETWHEDNQTHMSVPGGAGSIVSNPSDLVVFIDALFNNKLMTKESFALMTRIESEYGSGIFSMKKNGITFFGHNGGIDSFLSMLIYIPKLEIAIALNTNALDFDPMSIMFNAVNAVTGKDIIIPNFDTIELTEEEIEQYAGVYESKDLPFKLVFEAHGKTLIGGTEGSNLLELSARPKIEFTTLNNSGVVLDFDIKNKIVILKNSGHTPKTFIKKQ
ncbi:serine hydrolase domain-containing protein [Flavivirga rizhaonensis]|uniref:Class A beta-lactamase-related serine hydrolase n=1 Tax=Flavivirga rizhaonensis TaxID=2559571 RepID=A0A4S1DRB4_9FLAO|nr:serine hydrolase domain-containing protein [Flavivirga rizhaonensis]TGV00417.1 class A beta-lactamase-related serine hydrolase [Flavivirga rizhaonensis]